MRYKYRHLILLEIIISLFIFISCDLDNSIGESDNSSDGPPSRYHVIVTNNSGITLTIAYGTSGTQIRDTFPNGHSDTYMPMGDGYGLGNDVYAYNRPPSEAKGSGWYAHHTFSYDGERWTIK